MSVDGDARVLAVALCDGQRCRALRALAASPGTGGDRRVAAGDDRTIDGVAPSRRQLREAVAGRPGAVLVSTSCLGPCEQGCVVAVGAAVVSAAGSLTWISRPAAFGLAESPARSAALARWVGDGAPDLARLPDELRAPQRRAPQRRAG